MGETLAVVLEMVFSLLFFAIDLAFYLLEIAIDLVGNGDEQDGCKNCFR